MSEDFDLVIIGGGPGGYSSALYGASSGLNIALIEADKVGGTCLNRGCIPTKEFLQTAEVLRTVLNSSAFGIESNLEKVDFSRSLERKQKVVDQLQKGLSGLLRKRNVEVIKGKGFLREKNTVEVIKDGSKDRLTGNNIILAPGSYPKPLPNLEFDGEIIVNSDHVLELSEIPSSIIIIGAGAVGLEFASFFNAMGATVCVIEALSQVLPGADSEIAQLLTRIMSRRNIEIITSCQVNSVDKKNTGVKVSLSNGEEREAQMLLVAIGRGPNTSGLIDKSLPIEIDPKGFIMVKENLETSLPNHYALGDAINTPQLAHVGFAEGIFAIREILGENPPLIDYSKVPICIYTHPEVAFCGVTEEKAKALGVDIAIKKDPYGGNSRALILSEPEGLVKVIVAKENQENGGEIIGVHMIGPLVTETIYSGYLALNWEAQVQDFANLLAPHPTLSESFSETIIALTGRGLHIG